MSSDQSGVRFHACDTSHEIDHLFSKMYSVVANVQNAFYF